MTPFYSNHLKMGLETIMQRPSRSSTPFSCDVFGESIDDVDIWNDDSKHCFSRSIDKEFGDDFTVETAFSDQSSSVEHATGAVETIPESPKKIERRHSHTKKPLRCPRSDSNDTTGGGTDPVEQTTKPNDAHARPSRRRPGKPNRSDPGNSNESSDRSPKPTEPTRRVRRSRSSSDVVLVAESSEQSTNTKESKNDVEEDPKRLLSRKLTDSKTPTKPSRRRLVKERSIRDLYNIASNEPPTEKTSDPRRHGNPPMTPSRGGIRPSRNLDRKPERTRSMPNRSSSFNIRRQTTNNAEQSLSSSNHGGAHDNKTRRRMIKKTMSQSLCSSTEGEVDNDAARRAPRKTRSGLR